MTQLITDRIKADRYRQRHSTSTRAVSARITAELLRRSHASQWAIVSGGTIAAAAGGAQAVLTAPCAWTAMELHALLAEIPWLTLPLRCPCGAAASGYYHRHGDKTTRHSRLMRRVQQLLLRSCTCVVTSERQLGMRRSRRTEPVGGAALGLLGALRSVGTKVPRRTVPAAAWR